MNKKGILHGGRRKLVWQIFPAFLLMILLSLGAAGIYFSSVLQKFYLQETVGNLSARSILLEDAIEPLLVREDFTAIQNLVTRLGRETETRITVVDTEGRVLGDSDEDPSRMDNHGGRPEISVALDGGIGHAVRYSHTLNRNMVYVAVPIRHEGVLVGSVRTSYSARSIDETLSGVRSRLAFGGLGVALLAALISLSISRRISRPLVKMKDGAERFAQGELDRRLPVEGTEEVAGLAEALNQMAAQLDERIQTVLRQRNEQEAVLRSMVEGVLAVDADERILRINSAAGELLGVDPRNAEGRMIHEVARKADLQRFVARALAGNRPVEGDVVLRGEKGELYLQAHGSRLLDSQGESIGALVVLNDVTRLRRLENVRRDFVANVSHELKTPITAIRGFVETLLDGAIDSKEDARRFLEIIIRQSERLQSIIEDLLSLSRIEQESEKGGIELQQGPVRAVLLSAIQACEPTAQQKSVSLQLVCDESLRSRLNAPLLEQAVVNLIDNAVKYSLENSQVLVQALSQDGQVVIEVRDQGRGIAREHLPRVFERFYRVDKARSRKQGGTGLGLAIVKHIAQAHGGRVTVESVPGTGSIFRLHLPNKN